MASTHPRKGSPHLQVTLRVGDKRLSLSTGTQAVQDAQAVGDALQTLADASIAGITQQRALRLCAAVLEAAGVPVPWESQHEDLVTPVFAQWFRVNRTLMSDGTAARVKVAMASFCKMHGKRPLHSITSKDVLDWHSQLLGYNSPSSAKQKVRALTPVFAEAVADGMLRRNPTLKLKLDVEQVMEKRHFSPEEISRCREFYTREGMSEWLLFFNTALLTGLRMMDAVALHRRDFSFHDGTMILTTKMAKTNESLVVPVSRELRQMIESLPDAPLFPKLRYMSNANLSRAFSRHLERMGIESESRVSASGKTCKSLTFHSLRHTFITRLADSGVDKAIRMKLAGHKSEIVHQGYSHQDQIKEAVRIGASLG